MIYARRARFPKVTHCSPYQYPVRAMQADKSRGCLLFDVRGNDTAFTDVLPAFTPVSCGQLVQATDRWVGVRGARIVLADDSGMRAS